MISLCTFAVGFEEGTDADYWRLLRHLLADETYQRESRKGSREWVRHAKEPLQYPKRPRRRW
jgi:hypothetical protein